jgi:hypothetical protein
MSKNFRFILLTLSLIFCLSALAFGQQTAGTIEGTVKDPKGAVVPGASVTVEGVNVGFTRTVQADSNGLYRVQQAPPGTYKVSVAATGGFAATTLTEPVNVVIEKVTTADVTLSVSGTAVDVTVNSDAIGVVVDSTDSKIQTNVTAQLIESLPKGQSFSSVLRASPAVTFNTQLGSTNGSETGYLQIDGASSAENAFLVDGQEVTNFRSGTLNRVNNIPNALVQEVQIKTSGFEAEHGGASGGVIVVGTKSGSDQWRGEFGTQFEPSRLQPAPRFAPAVARSGVNQAVYAIAQPKDSYNTVYPTATFGGPIKKGRVWFIGSYSPQIFESTRQTVYYTSPTFANGGHVVPDNTKAPQTFHGKQTLEYAFSRVDAAITNNLRVFASYLWNPAVYEGFGGSQFFPGFPQAAIATGASPICTTLSGTQYCGSALFDKQGGRTNSNNFSSQAVWTPTQKAVISFRYGRSFLNEKGGVAYGVPTDERFICTGTTPYPAGTNCTIGFQSNSGNNLVVKDVSIRNTLNADISYLVNSFGGSHNFKGGYELGRVKNDVNRGYRFAGITQLFYGYAFEDLGVPGHCDLGVDCVGVGELLRFGTVGVASNKYNGLYIQDKWQPTRRLTLNLGVRAENENLPSFNTGGGTGTGTASAGIPFKFGWGDKIAPRLGGAYDIFGNGKSRIFASYGIFYDRLKFEAPRGSFGGDFYRDDYFPILTTHPEYSYYTLPRILGNWTDPIGGGNPSTQGGLSQQQYDYRIPSNLQPSVYAGLGLPLGAVDPNLKPFTQREVTVGYEQEVFNNYVFSARFTKKDVLHAIEDQANLGFYEAESYIQGNVGEGLAFEQRQAAGYVKQTKVQRDYRALEFVLNRRLTGNYFYNVSYTWSRLFGNYSGLASSDEAGRASPGVNRFFDYAVNGYTATGDPDNGLLATDRTHTFKAYGGYMWDWWHSKTNTTEIDFFQTIQSGTPQTTFIGVAATSIPLSKRGDLGRTPTFSQTDLTLRHGYKFGRDSRFELIGEINVLNVFNQNTVTAFNTTRYLIKNTLGGSELDPCYNPDGDLNPGCTTANRLLTQALNNILNGKIGSQLSALESIAGNKSKIYGAASAYQAPRNVRFGVRLRF